MYLTGKTYWGWSMWLPPKVDFDISSLNISDRIGEQPEKPGTIEIRKTESHGGSLRGVSGWNLILLNYTQFLIYTWRKSTNVDFNSFSFTYRRSKMVYTKSREFSQLKAYKFSSRQKWGSNEVIKNHVLILPLLS